MSKETFELYIKYDKLMVNEFTETLNALNNCYKTIDKEVHKHYEKYRLINLFDSRVNNNLEIEGFEKGSLFTKLIGKKESIEILLSIMVSSVTLINPVTDMVAEKLEKYYTDDAAAEEKVLKNNEIFTQAEHAISTLQGNKNFSEVKIIVTNEDGTRTELIIKK